MKTVHFLILLFTTQSIALYAQNTERPKPWFSLSIEAADPSHLPAHYTSERRVVLVKFTNNLNVDVSDTDMGPTFGLDMHVFQDGAPAEQTETMRVLQERRHQKRESKYPRNFSVQEPVVIKPGKNITVPLPVGDYFDMTKPGTYKIQTSRDTFPYDPAKSVTVWSNTIVIIVPKAS